MYFWLIFCLTTDNLTFQQEVWAQAPFFNASECNVILMDGSEEQLAFVMEKKVEQLVPKHILTISIWITLL